MRLNIKGLLGTIVIVYLLYTIGGWIWYSDNDSAKRKDANVAAKSEIQESKPGVWCFLSFADHVQ